MNTLASLSFLAVAPTSQPVDPPFWASPWFMIYAVVIIGVFMMTNSGKAKKAQEKTRKDMLTNLKRGDRVETIGGILASVVEARENEVVLKIDESTNTKIRIARDAIKRVVIEETESQAK
jgi:preprotein translocase subunit YajC